MVDDRSMAQTTLVPPATPPAPARGRLFWAGLALMLAGLVLLGYVAWQFFGTNVVSHHQQQQIVDRTRQLWSERGTTIASPRDRLGSAEALVRIPAFGKDHVVPVQPGVSDEVLAEGYGHFPGTAKAGQVGNYAIAAHRITHGEPLRHMPDLRPGDKVLVETRNRTYTYRLDTDPNKLIVTFNDVWVISTLPRNPHGGVEPAQRPGQRLITLTTCSELFHTDNRMIAFGHLVRSAPR
jgi:sortase A